MKERLRRSVPTTLPPRRANAEPQRVGGFQEKRLRVSSPRLILALAGSDCVVSVHIEADIDAEIGARLAEVRRRCGLTQRQLAKAVGVQLTTVQNWSVGAPGSLRSAWARSLTRYIASRSTS